MNCIDFIMFIIRIDEIQNYDVSKSLKYRTLKK